MTTPNKIYIGTVTLSSNEPGEQHLLPDWHKRPNPKVANVEYICKDALLEKLEKVVVEYKKRSDKGELVWQHMCGIKEAINILNSM